MVPRGRLSLQCRVHNRVYPTVAVEIGIGGTLQDGGTYSRLSTKEKHLAVVPFRCMLSLRDSASKERAVSSYLVAYYESCVNTSEGTHALEMMSKNSIPIFDPGRLSTAPRFLLIRRWVAGWSRGFSFST